MKTTKILKLAVQACCAVLFVLAPRNFAQAPLGLFEGHDDVGTVQHQGAVKYDAATRTYTISGGGENMWAATDAFHFVWKKVSGDVSLAADLSILGTGGNPHRKGVLMIRQSLEADSAYVSVALHGVGLTALQSREAKGAQTYEVISNVSAPARLQVLKRGQDFHMWLNRGMGGGSFRVPLTAPFYVGLGVCAHDKDAVETVVFSNVELTTGALKPARKPVLYSTLETVRLAARTDRQAVLAASERIEAPNWTRDGAGLLFNSGGRTKRIPLTGGTPELIDAISTAGNDGDQAKSPDGKYRYFTADSAGSMQVWRVSPDGSQREQVTSDDYSNWYPRVSPDGRWVLVLSCGKSVKGEPRDTDVTLRLLSFADGKISLLAKLVGGQGTLGASAWSPDSRSVTFVSYQSIP